MDKATSPRHLRRLGRMKHRKPAEGRADEQADPTHPSPSQIKEAVRFILIAFLASRAVLTFIGVLARVMIGRQQHVGGYAKELVHVDAQHGLWLSIWGVWDTSPYLRIADNWYPTGASADYGTYAFFPLYPLLMRVVGFPFGSSFIGGVIVSNLALLAGAWVLYRLTAMETDHRTGLRAALFLLLCPVGFIFSGVFTESTFLAFTVAAFYCARRCGGGNGGGRYWLYACALGGLAAMSRVPGAFIAPLLLWEYMKRRDYDVHKIRPDVLFLALVPLGLSLFMLQCYWLIGDGLAFLTVQKAWGREYADPVSALATAIGSGHLPYVMGACSSIAVLLAVTVFHRRIGPIFLVWTLILTLLPLSSTTTHNTLNLLRYTMVAFPLFILMAKIPDTSPWNQALILALALLQGCLMVFWTNNFMVII